MKKNSREVVNSTALDSVVNAEGWNQFYCYDHFHPNEGGYQIIAEMIANNILGEQT